MACLDDGVIARYVRGQSAPEELALVEAHLPGCPRCEVRVAQAQELLKFSESTQRTDLSSGPGGRPTGSTDPEEVALRPAPPLERGSTVGRYLIIDRVGEGGMGVVYAAYDPELNRKVAVKLLRATRIKKGGSDEDQARLLREAQAMARIAHPNVISVYDVGTLGDRIFVAMEFVEGMTLSRWVKQKQRSWREVLAVFLDAGKGLAAAHEAGLVHRDFKPENVLIGKDDRVRVMDFGLARLEDSPTAVTQLSLSEISKEVGKEIASPNPGRVELVSTVTRDGVVMGTPQYMSPEQRLGLAAEARSDQFSFCAALYWALYRKPAFDPMLLAAAAIEASDHPPQGSGERQLSFKGQRVIHEPPKEPPVPAWLKRAMLRGLELSPDDRFPSMEALLTALRTDPGAVRRRWYAAVAGVALGVIGSLSWYQLAPRSQTCADVEQRLTGVWDDITERAIRGAFLATGKPYAVSSFAGVQRILDAYARAWVEMSRGVCQDTVQGMQTQQLLSLRTVCLDRRLKDLRALTRLLSTADAETMEQAVNAAHALPGLGGCADVETLSLPVSPPDDPASREKIEQIGSLLASGKAHMDAGKYKAGLERAQAAVRAAEGLPYLPMQAEAYQLLGWLLVKEGDTKSGEANLTQAVWLAEEGRHDEVKAIAATRLVYAVGSLQRRFEEAQLWSQLATATLNRLGESRDVRIELLINVASTKLRQRRSAEALEWYERAAQLAGPNHPKRSNILIGQAIIHRREGAHDRARSLLLEALELIEKEHGPVHPAAAYAHNALFQVHRAKQDYGSALLHVRKALTIWEAALGAEHPLVGSVYNNLATIYFDQRDFAEALTWYQRALEVNSKALQPSDPGLGYSYLGLGETYLQLGQARQAVPHLERALTTLQKDPNGPSARFALAKALWDARQDRARARTLAIEARDGFREAEQKEMAAEVDAWLTRAR